jgi:proline dehydrogenase
MLPRIRPTPFFRRTLYSRSYSTGAPRRGYFIAGTALAATGSGAFYLSNSPGLQSHRGEQDAHGPSLRELARSCVVYAMCSVPALVDAAPTILTKLLAIPGISKVTEGIVRSTFFAQFVGGESVKDAIPLIDRMREQNIGTLLAYSVEVDEHSANQSLGAALTRKDPELAIHRLNVEEMIRSVDEAGDHEDRISHLVRRDSSVGRSTWVAVKLVSAYAFELERGRCI